MEVEDGNNGNLPYLLYRGVRTALRSSRWPFTWGVAGLRRAIKPWVLRADLHGALFFLACMHAS